MSQKFDPKKFMHSPSLEVFDSLVKDDLITLGKHLDLEVKKAMKKDQIQEIILKHLVGLELFDTSVLESRLMPDVELRKLELQLELKKLEMQKEQELREQKLQEKEKDRLERKKEIDRLEREKEKDRLEREKERELHLEKQRLDHELELKKLELVEKLGSRPTGTSSSSTFDITKHIMLVPPFQEVEVDKYFLHFEKVAENLKWPKDYWNMLLQSVIMGKAREFYTQLPVQQASNYDSVKQLILKGYELVPEAYRQRFRNCEKESKQTYVEFARTKEQLFDGWCSRRRLMMIIIT